MWSMSHRHHRATAHAARVAARELAVANGYHHRAELARRAAMTPDQRAAVDHTLEVEQVTAAGRKAANEKAFTVVAVGVILAWVAGSLLTGWLVAPVLAVTVALTVSTWRARMRMLAAELDAIEGVGATAL